MAGSQNKRLIGCAIVLVVVFGAAMVFTIIMAIVTGKQIDVPDFSPGVAVVDVFGVIGQDDRVLEQLDVFEDDANVRALVLHVNSPGGGVATTQRIVERLAAFRAEGVPIVAALESVAASGGYYIACSADSIITLPGTLTGSIGVIMAFPEFSALFTKLGIEYQVVTAGEFKDFGTFHRPMTDVERDWIEGVLEEVLDQFVAAVDDGRPLLEASDVREVADGRIFSGQMAVDLGLADRVGTVEDAIAVAGELAGLKGDPRIIRKGKERTFWERMMGEQADGLAELASLAEGRWPRLEYRWH
jgi:protease-4